MSPRTVRSKVEWNRLERAIPLCEACPRLRRHCAQVAREKRRAFRDQEYWGRPVPNFGDARARLLVIGLAPAAHGANRTGRMFTGDRSGEWLYRALHRAGFASQAEATGRGDGLALRDCAITAVCHCAPPDNRPTPIEIRACEPWLESTVEALPARVWVALGGLAWRAAAALAARRGWRSGPLPRFSHGSQVSMAGGRWLLGCYHPSQQNTFTGRLTEPMLDAVLSAARGLL